MTEKKIRIRIDGSVCAGTPGEIYQAVAALEAICNMLDRTYGAVGEARHRANVAAHQRDAALADAAQARAELASARGNNLADALTACAEVTAQRDALLVERNAARDERDAALERLDETSRQAYRLIQERDAVGDLNLGLRVEVAALQTQRDTARAEVLRLTSHARNA